MDIACPACATRYVVPDSAIGADGRVLRCAKCRYSWFQDGPDAAGQPVATADDDLAETAFPAPAPGLASPPAAEAPPPADRVSAADAGPPPASDFAEASSSFAYEPPFRPRRSRATFWITALILFVLVAAGAIAAMASFGIPDWLPVPHNAFAVAQPDLKLNFPADQQQWRPLPNGNSFFHVSGSVTNTGQQRSSVPTLEIVLHDEHHALVYSLDTASPRPVLAPGESETIDQAIIDAPKSARTATIGWKGQ